MQIVSFNDNLLERLQLVVQNSSILSPQDGSGAVEARGCLASNLSQCDASTITDWILLLPKDCWEPSVVETIGDLYRLLLSKGVPNQRLLFLKNDIFPTDAQYLSDEINSIRLKWTNDCQSQLDKYSKLGESAARSDQLANLQKWLSLVEVVEYQLAAFDDLELPKKIASFFGCGGGLIIKEEEEKGAKAEGGGGGGAEDGQGSRSNLHTKPPALHWTQTPREAEVQVSLKFTFPQGTITDPLFRQLTAAAQDLHLFEYTYEWTNGLFLRQDLVKVTIVQAPTPNVVEVSGRIDVDEAADGDESGEGDDGPSAPTPNAAPLKRVWPFLAKVLASFIERVDGVRALPYTVSMVFIGEAFFSGPLTARPVVSRSLDAVQTLSAIQRAGSVRFKLEEHIYSLKLDQCFPGFKPTRLSYFCGANFPLAKPTLRESVSSPPRATIGAGVTFDRDYPDGRGLPTAAPEGSSSDKSPSPHSLTVAGQRNRGRRVSFGAIRAIPNLSDLEGMSGSLGGAGAQHRRSLEAEDRQRGDSGGSGGGVMFSKERAISGEGKKAPPRQEEEVDGYVETMLQKTIDEVLILNE